MKRIDHIHIVYDYHEGKKKYVIVPINEWDCPLCKLEEKAETKEEKQIREYSQYKRMEYDDILPDNWPKYVKEMLRKVDCENDALRDTNRRLRIELLASKLNERCWEQSYQGLKEGLKERRKITMRISERKKLIKRIKHQQMEKEDGGEE